LSLKQKLAAILAADVRGYSRLMSQDGRATIAALDAAREVFRANVELHQGRVIDTAGDAVLACFDTAIGAVGAALAIQRALGAAAAGVPEDRCMRFRVGIHLGDVFEKTDGTIYGDGVNIAARIESLAQPGGIAVSELIWAAVRGKVDATFADEGEHQVKNIADPIRVYRVSWDGAPAPAARPVTPRPSEAPRPPRPSEEPPLPDKPSIAVLPFSNMSGDADQEFFADGIAEDIITELSRISGLLVIARNSTFVYKKQAVDIHELGRKLGVRHVLEGSVRKAGTRVRITAQLIATATGGHVWAERFDRELEDIFAVQDEVTARIVEALKVKVTAEEAATLAPRGKVNIEVYDLVIRARACHFRYTSANAGEARGLLDRALQIDPAYAPAYAVLGMVHAAEYINGWVRTDGHVERGLAHAARAVELDPEDADARYAYAMLSLWQRNYPFAEEQASKAIALAPSYAPGFMAHGQVLDFSGRHDEAIRSFEQALRLDPGSEVLIHLLGRAQFGAGQLEAAEVSFQRRLARNPRTDMSRAYLASIYGSTGRTDEARRLWAEILELNPSFTIEHLRRVLPYRDPSWFERLAGGLRKADVMAR
jgi:adenylate cyclase